MNKVLRTDRRIDEIEALWQVLDTETKVRGQSVNHSRQVLAVSIFVLHNQTRHLELWLESYRDIVNAVLSMCHTHSQWGETWILVSDCERLKRLKEWL
jgi:hypothetical protein